MRYTVVIPSRYASTRLPGKPLLDIMGKPMVVRVAEQALKGGAERVIVATDDTRIRDAVLASGVAAEVCMTSPDHNSGTERIAEVVNAVKLGDQEIVINVQGDEPLIPPENIAQVADLLECSQAPMATLCAQITGEDVFDPNCVKVVINYQGDALYFSRAPIPYERNSFRAGDMSAPRGHARHIGIYAYRVGFIRKYMTLPPCEIEALESLEQLRVLYHGYRIAVTYAETDPLLGVDTAEDLERVRKIFSEREKKKK